MEAKGGSDQFATKIYFTLGGSHTPLVRRSALDPMKHQKQLLSPLGSCLHLPARRESAPRGYSGYSGYRVKGMKKRKLQSLKTTTKTRSKCA